MEYKDGSKVNPRRSLLDEKQALLILLQMCHALAHMSSHTVVHRKVIPTNIYIKRERTSYMHRIKDRKSMASTASTPACGSTTSERTADGDAFYRVLLCNYGHSLTEYQLPLESNLLSLFSADPMYLSPEYLAVSTSLPTHAPLQTHVCKSFVLIPGRAT